MPPKQPAPGAAPQTPPPAPTPEMAPEKHSHVATWLFGLLFLVALIALVYSVMLVMRQQDTVKELREQKETALEMIEDKKAELAGEEAMEETSENLLESWSAIVAYNCELSNGEFENGECVCPIEEQFGQTQDMMYSEDGFCQTTFGGSGGDAFFAGSGLPWGNYSYYNDIINYWCDESGGSKSGAACICSDEAEYNKTTGRCE